MEGQEASGLSELSKSFFFAGTRSILATHWSVNAGTTEILLKKLFDGLAQHRDWPRVLALQQASIKFIDGLKPEDFDCNWRCKAMNWFKKEGNWLREAMNKVYSLRENWSEIPSSRPIHETIDSAHPYYWAPFMILGEGGVLKAQ